MNLSYFKKILLTVAVGTGMIFGTSALAQNYRLPGQHTEQSENLLANQNAVNANALLAPQIDYLNFDEEEEPEAGDIYEYGWDSNKLNCYSGVKVEDNVRIDLGKSHMPHPGYITSPYGYRAKFGRMHKGVDIKVNTGDNICAAFSGRVRITKYEAGGYGYYVVIRHHNGLETVYAHLSKILVEPDQDVKEGDIIGLGGSTGHSTGPHLHFETRYMGYAINPAAIFDFANQVAHTDTYTFNKNTYTEARDFSPKANAEYAKEYLKNNPTKPAPAKTTKSSTAKKQDAKNQNKKQTAKKSEEKGKYVQAKSGDSLSKIAARNHTTVTALCKLNGLTTKSKIQTGQKIRVQ